MRSPTWVHDSLDYAATVLGREQQAFAGAAAEVKAVDFLAEHIVDEFAEGGQIGCVVGVCRCNERGPSARVRFCSFWDQPLIEPSMMPLTK